MKQHELLSGRVPFDEEAGPGTRTSAWDAPRRVTPRPESYQHSDERLKEDISRRLTEAVHIDPNDISVEVRGATVVLEGTVPDRRTKRAIEALVDDCPGVQDIDNRVRVA